ncbi:MAG: adenylate/guanylate cyclase domain-containing protein [Spirochaetales bacterium]|nr:adenylate/guanylate cyclase domain-containing protein [Spirochaetales bacterium]
MRAETNPDRDDPLENDRFLLELLVGSSFAYSIVYAFVNYHASFVDGVPASISILYAAYLVFIYLIGRYRILWMALLFYAGAFLSVTGYAIALGSGFGMHFFLLPVAVGAPFLFRRDRLLAVVTGALPVLAFCALLVLNFSGTSIIVSDLEETASLYLRVNAISATAFLLVEILLIATFLNRTLERLAAEKGRNYQLLCNLIPESLLGRFLSNDRYLAYNCDQAVVIFVDIVGFTELSVRSDPNEVVRMLNDIYSDFDELADQFGVEKIKTIGDSYMAAVNVIDQTSGAFENAARFALDIVRIVSERYSHIGVRVGMASGPLVAGAVGKHRIFFDIWGPVVNLASRLEKLSAPGRVLCSMELVERLRPAFQFAEESNYESRGIGETPAAFLLGATGTG